MGNLTRSKALRCNATRPLYPASFKRILVLNNPLCQYSNSKTHQHLRPCLFPHLTLAVNIVQLQLVSFKEIFRFKEFYKNIKMHYEKREILISCNARVIYGHLSHDTTGRCTLGAPYNNTTHIWILLYVFFMFQYCRRYTEG